MSCHSCIAKKLFEEGYNCSQSVLAAFCDETGLDTETALRISSSFGGGMGRMREVCGAVSGMFMAAGLKYGYTDASDKQAKAEHYRLIRSLGAQFQAENGSIICRQLLGLSEKEESPVPQERTEDYYKKRPCAEFVECAARILDEYIKNNETEKRND